MKLLSIEYIPGVDFEPLGIVKGTVVQTYRPKMLAEILWQV